MSSRSIDNRAAVRPQLTHFISIWLHPEARRWPSGIRLLILYLTDLTELKSRLLFIVLFESAVFGKEDSSSEI